MYPIYQSLSIRIGQESGFYWPGNFYEGLSAFAAALAVFVAVFVYKEGKKSRRSTWLASQNQAWSDYNLSCLSDKLSIEANEQINNVYCGFEFDKAIVRSYPGRIFSYARVNILEVEYFGYKNSYTDVTTLYFLVGSAKSVSSRYENISAALQFTCLRETYDPEFASFFGIIVLYFCWKRTAEGKNKRYVDGDPCFELRADRLDKKQINWIIALCVKNKRGIIAELIKIAENTDPKLNLSNVHGKSNRYRIDLFSKIDRIGFVHYYISKIVRPRFNKDSILKYTES